MDNYIMLNGKKIELTDEQIKLIQANQNNVNDRIENCFDRVKNGDEYYFIDWDGEVIQWTESHSISDTGLYNIANYCTNEKIMKQRALHEILNRLLWKFSMMNDGDKIDWTSARNKTLIYYSHDNNKIKIDSNVYCKFSTIYFYSTEIAQRAIDEIIIPFMNDHPEFVW